MAYKIAFKKSVSKDLKRLPPAEADRILRNIASELPSKADTLPVLQGRFAGLRKHRVGEYRIIFSIVDETLLILRIKHRKDVYKA